MHADGVDHTAPGTTHNNNNNVAASATGFANALPSMPAFPTQDEVIAKHPHLAPKSAEQLKVEISAKMSKPQSDNDMLVVEASGAQAEQADESVDQEEYTMQQTK